MTSKTWTDPIVDEIHEIRAKLVEQAGGDFDNLIARLKSAEEGHRDRVVTLEKRSTTLADSES